MSLVPIFLKRLSGMRGLLNAVLVTSIFFSLAYAQEKKGGISTVIDARNWDPSESLFKISGNFQFFEGELLDPSQVKNTRGIIKNFPCLIEENKKNPRVGFATYYIRLAVPSAEKDLALYIPQIYSSYKLWVNDKLIAKNGVVAKTEEAAKPQWLPQSVEFTNTKDTLSLVLQIANFHHAKAGVKENIYLGSQKKIEEKKRIAIVANLSETVILFLIGFLFLMVFLFGQQKGVAFYFSMLCLTWAVRSVFSNQYLFTQYYPQIDWNLQLRVEYISLFLTILWGTLTVSNLYKSEANSIVKYALAVIPICFVGVSLFTSPREFTQWLSIYILVGICLIIYAAVVVIRAWIKDRKGSSLLAVSIFIGLFIFGYDIFVFEFFSSYNAIVFSLGYISIFTLIGLALALHINLIRSGSSATTHLTYDDMFKKE